MNINSEKFATELAAELVKDSIKFAWSKVKGYFEDLDARTSIEFGMAYERYLENMQIKNEKIKTLIFRHVPKDLYSFYECIGVSYNGKNIDTSSVNNLIKAENRIIITGTGGIGKSILFKHLFLNSIKETSLIPILLELRSFNSLDIKEISLFDAVYNSLEDNGFRLDKKYFKFSMEKGGYIILLDGYDEVNRERYVKVTEEIKSVCNKYSDNKYIISSRPSDVFIGWNDFAEMTTQSLTKEQALSLIDKIEFDKTTKETFAKELEEKLYDKYSSFASNPLLLTIMLLTFDNHAAIPDKLNDFYDQAFTTLFNMHDATKDSFKRDIRTGLGCEDFKWVFSHLCFKSYFNGEYEFTEAKLHKYIKDAKERTNKNKFKIEDFQDDLLHSVCMLVKDGLNYRFSHRSFQEYFAAWYTCKLTDDQQRKFLLSWMKESHSFIYDSYLTMLFNMQSEKTNKIVFCPVLKQLKLEYEKCGGYTISLLNKVFNGVAASRVDRENEKKEIVLLPIIKNFYYYGAVLQASRLNEFAYNHEIRINSPVAKAIYESQKYNDISFEKASEIAGEEILLSELNWFHEYLLFCFSLIDRYADNNFSRKRNVASMLDEL